MSDGARKCCCDCGLDCLFGTGVTSGCCHKSDTLVLWNNRPEWEFKQHYKLGDCETCYTRAYPGDDPVQSIYKYYDCFYRVVHYGVDGPITQVTLPESDGTFQGEACGNPVCDTSVEFPDVCCGTQFTPFPNTCLCSGRWFGTGKGGLSNWRYREMTKDPATKWFIETTCHKDGAALSGSIGALYDEALFTVYKERWWKIANNDGVGASGCTANAHIVVPGGTCNNIQTDDLVPKYFIFACSGIPIYQFEVDEALGLSYITQDQYDDIMDAVSFQTQPPQPALKAMARGGYFTGKDWRAEQEAAYRQLESRFPNSGYTGCSMGCTGDNYLAPFRKRATEAIVGTNNTPLLHIDDVVDGLSGFQPPCMLDYPGNSSNQSDYDYWRTRQWVYFSGIPGGWIWAGWDALAQSMGAAETEEEAILMGYSRGDGVNDPVDLITSPMLAFRGEPQCTATCTACPDMPACPGTTFCDSCTSSCTSCGAVPVANCDPPAICNRFSIHPECQGVHFVFSKYQYNNYLDDGCLAGGTYECLFQVHSYLTEGERTYDFDLQSCPNKCVQQEDPLPAFNGWDPIERGHELPDFLCGLLLDPNSGYTLSDFCCGAYCTEYNYVTYYEDEVELEYPCPYPGDFHGCTLPCETPPHGITARGGNQYQIDCIGYVIQGGSGGTC